VLTDNPSSSGDLCEMVSVETQTDPRPRTRSTTFYVGDSSGEESDNDIDAMATVTTTETETQTEESVECQLPIEPRPPRPLQECVAILKSAVGLHLLTSVNSLVGNGGKQDHLLISGCDVPAP